MLILYIDDRVIILKEKLELNFDKKDLGYTKDILGMCITYKTSK